MKRKSRKRKQNTLKKAKRKKKRYVARTIDIPKNVAPDLPEGKTCDKGDLSRDMVKKLGKREQKWAVALTYEQCKLSNDSAKSMLGSSGNESSSDISDDDESSDEDNRSSTNDNNDSDAVFI